MEGPVYESLGDLDIQSGLWRSHFFSLEEGQRGGGGGGVGGQDFSISMEANLLRLLCTVRGPLQAYTRGLYFGALALFNTITTPPFCPDLLALFICISRSLGCKVSSGEPL